MILFVDDEIFRIDPILATFEIEGLSIKAVDNGIDCISFVENYFDNIELIIVDLMIPYGEQSVKDIYPGIELITDIQKITNKVPIIVFTNVASEEIQDFLKGLDIKEIIRKFEVDPLELVEIAKKYVRKIKQQLTNAST